jgi:hypothetical protein
MYYRYNSFGCGWDPVTWEWLGLGAFRSFDGEDDAGLPESRVLVPSDMIAVGDAGGGWFDQVGGFGWPGGVETQHQDRSSNAVFCDDHVETSYSDRIATEVPTRGWPPVSFTPDAAHTKRWNNDNQPHPELWPTN